MSGRRRIGIFGGTFDPVHVGHLAIARAALECVPLNEVRFVPARRSPLKDRGPFASEADRLEMLRLAIAGEPGFSLSTVELEREGASYTVDTLESFKDEGELFLILGADAASDLHRWRRPDRITELATLLIAQRPGVADPPPGPRVMPLDAPRLDISSRELRARAARGRSLRYLVPDAAREYLERRGMYSEDARRTT